MSDGRPAGEWKVKTDQRVIEPVIAVDHARLERALHLIRHEHGPLWPPTPGCGCNEWAAALFDALIESR